MKKNQLSIVVLGATGLVGHVVYRYLQDKFSNQVFGTSRDKSTSELLYLNVMTFVTDITDIQKKMGTISHIINCIGLIKGQPASSDDFIEINTNFPHLLEDYFLKTDTKILHISSDAVFEDLAGTVTEKDIPTAKDVYGSSKLLGELSGPNTLTIRTSFLGFDSNNKKGLLEWIGNYLKKIIPGFINQKWSGCTTLQFAKLCGCFIDDEKKFSMIRSTTSVVHFTPLTATKYEIIKSTIELRQLSITVQASEGKKITRKLESNFERELQFKHFTQDLHLALQDLMKFNKVI